MIIVNKAKCKVCKDIIESKHTHDYVECSCGEISVDGGKDYLRRGYKEDINNLIKLSEIKEDQNV